MKQHSVSLTKICALITILLTLITVGNVNASLPEYNWHLFTNGATPSAQTIDANGNILIAGIATNSWLGNNNESPTHAYSEAGSVWLLKLDQNGNYLWHTFFGDNSTVSGHHFLSLDTDTAGNIYVAGNVSQFSNWNGPDNEPPLEAFHGGNVDGYLAKIDAAGAYQWHRFIGPNGASSHEATHSVAVDSSGDIYTANADLLGAFFVTKYNASGAEVWQFTYGEASQFGQGQIHIDGNDAVFIVHHSTFDRLFNGPIGELPLHSLSMNNDRGFHILKLDKDANYQWHTFHGGQVDDNGVNSGDDVQLVISSTSNGDLYVAGGAEGSWLEDITAPTNAYQGSGDVFVMKFNSQGSYQWHTFWGSDQTEGGPSLAFDDEENILISAYTVTNWLGPNDEQPLAPLLEQSGGVALAMDSDSSYLWHTFLNGSIRTISNDVNSLYLVGDGRYGTQHLETNLLGTDTTLPLSGLTPNEGLYILKYDFGNFVPDDVPDAFSFTSLANVEINSIALSETITITGINVAAEISITGGEYSLDSGPYTDTIGSISNGQTVRIRTTASAAFDTTQSVVITIGGISAAFDVTTKTAPDDDVPDTFAFTSLTNVEINSTALSETITITGINVAAEISITGGEYSLDTGQFTDTIGSISNGQTVRIRTTASAAFDTTQSVVLTIGGVSATFDIITKTAPDNVPSAFSFTPIANVEINSIALSEMITISGINVATGISITGGEYSLDSGPYTDTIGSISNGQTVRIRTTASAAFDTTQSVVLTIGGVSATFDVTTKTDASSGSGGNSGGGSSGGGSTGIPTLMLLIFLLALRRTRKVFVACTV